MLSNAFELHGENVKAAIKAYELDRRPRVENIQQSAEESQTYFETLKRYKHLEPTQFAFHLLTRSGRLNYDNLRLRDPYFVDKVERWFSRQSSAAGGHSRAVPLQVALPPMHTGLKVREMMLTNRAVLSITTDYSAQDGLPNENYVGQAMQQAQSGAAMLLTEPIAISVEGRNYTGMQWHLQ